MDYTRNCFIIPFPTTPKVFQKTSKSCILFKKPPLLQSCCVTSHNFFPRRSTSTLSQPRKPTRQTTHQTAYQFRQRTACEAVSTRSAAAAAAAVPLPPIVVVVILHVGISIMLLLLIHRMHLSSSSHMSVDSAKKMLPFTHRRNIPQSVAFAALCKRCQLDLLRHFSAPLHSLDFVHPLSSAHLQCLRSLTRTRTEHDGR